MTANDALDLLLEMDKTKGENIIDKESVVCVIARAGSDNPVVKADSIENLTTQDFGSPLHTIVIPGKLHFMEIEALEILAQLPAQQRGKLQKL